MIDIPHTYVINLASSQNRRKHMISQLVDAMLPFSIIDAVDKDHLDDINPEIYDPKLALPLQGRELTSGEVACALSHVNIWKMMVEQGDDHALILEDDAVFSPELLEILRRIDKFPSDWSVINLHSDSTKFEIVDALNDSLSIKKFSVGMNRTTGYLIRSTAVEMILRYAIPVRKNADGLFETLRRMGKLVCYGTEPQLIDTNEIQFPTLIGER